MWRLLAVPVSITEALAPLSSVNTRGPDPPTRTCSEASFPLSVNGITATGRGTVGAESSVMARKLQASICISAKS